MTDDHYVAQTYLKHFHTKDSERCVNAILKPTLKELNGVNTRNICQSSNWNTIPCVKDNPRVVEEYLQLFEPKWNDCVKKLETNEFNQDVKYLMAGYIVFLRACTPTAVRLAQNDFGEMIKNEYYVRARKELNDPSSPHAEAIRLIEQHGGIKVNIDSDFIKAHGATFLADGIKRFFEFPWLILRNETDAPFLTSDNPLCLDFLAPTMADFYLPITPRIAVVIRPVDAERRGVALRDSQAEVREERILHFNRLVVRHAENVVVFNTKFYHWLRRLVKKFRYWRTESHVSRLPCYDGFYTLLQQRVKRREDI